MEEEAKIKGLTEDILNKYLSFIDENKVRGLTYNLIEDEYVKGMQKAEIGFNMNFVPDYKAISFVQSFAFDNVKKLVDDLKDQLRKEVSLALLNRETPVMIQRRIRDVLDTTIERAKLIQITETNRAFNMGHYQGAKESGRDYVKEWSAPEDERTCDTCGYLHGKTTGMNQVFNDPQGKQYFLPPAHPRCRCRILYVKK